jgi:hypothetical protein
LAAQRVTIVEPLKLTAVFVAGDDHFITAAFVMVCACAANFVVTERLFVIVKPKLLKLSWFAALWRPLVPIRSRLLRSLGGRFFLKMRRTALWQWEDGQ